MEDAESLCSSNQKWWWGEGARGADTVGTENKGVLFRNF